MTTPATTSASEDGVERDQHRLELAGVVEEPPDAVRRRRGLVGGRAAAIRPLAAGHEQAELVAGGVGPVEHADERAAVDHADPIGQGEHLVELGGHEQHGGAPVAHLDDAAVDELDRADVESPGRLGDDQQLHVAGQLAGDDHLLLVAAREVVHRDVGARACGRRTRFTSSTACRSMASSSRRPRRAKGCRR